MGFSFFTFAMNRKGFPPFTVTYLGKAATFNLMYAFPFLLLAQKDGAWGTIAYIFGWSFAQVGDGKWWEALSIHGDGNEPKYEISSNNRDNHPCWNDVANQEDYEDRQDIETIDCRISQLSKTEKLRLDLICLTL